LGLETAGWLVERGATHLVLVGRRPPGEKANAVIEAWTTAGVHVTCVQADIGESGDADRVFTIVNGLRVPLRGVVHSAGTLDDAALLQQDWPRFERVLKAKVEGSWNLHLRTRSVALDFFVLFSSGASLFGSMGQANHAAGNAFLDGLALYRRSRRLPGLSINWGAWRETGVAARKQVLERLARSGINTIDTRNGLQALECLLAAGSSRAAVLPIDWPTFRGHGGNITDSSLFAELAKEFGKKVPGVPDPAVEARRWQEKFKSANSTRREVLLKELVDREAASVLGVASSHPIDPRQPLQELGLDSLMAVQLRKRLATWVGIELPPTLLYNCPTVEQLTAHLTQCVNSEGACGEEPIAHSEQPSQAEFDDISEEEIAKMLEEQINMA